MIPVREMIGSHDVLLVTLDTLRYDVAQGALLAGQTPHLERLLPGRTWERRHSPGNCTYAAHQVFFAGFLPTPIAPGKHPRLFAARFPGSETTGDQTFVFDAPDVVTGLTRAGYRTICIGGVGFLIGGVRWDASIWHWKRVKEEKRDKDPKDSKDVK